MASASTDEPQPGPSGYSKKLLAYYQDVSKLVADEISGDWMRLGTELGLENSLLDNIRIEFNAYGVKEWARRMLLQWVERQNQEATVNRLAHHLEKIGRTKLSSEILKLADIPQTPKSCMTERRQFRSPSPSNSEMELKRQQESRSPSPRYHQAEINRAWESIMTTLRTEHSRLQIPKMPWLEKEWETSFEDFYVDLTISNKNEDAKPLLLHEIFDSISQSSHKFPTRILIEGPAGYGKSTLARKLCFDHAMEKRYIRHFDAVILLRLREFDGTPQKWIIDTYELENCRAELLLEILTQNQRKILFVLDGFDELHPDNHPHVIPLLKGKQYPQSTVIVTSRMGCMKVEGERPGSSVTNLLHCMTSRISIVGVSGENRVTFLQLYLKGYSSEKCASFIKSTDRKFGLSEMMEGNLFDCPLYLLLLVVVAEETDLASLTSKTQLYKHLFNFILRRMLAKEGQVDQTCDFFDFSVENPPAHVEMLFRFGSFAGDALLNKQYTFTEKEILRACGNDGTILKLGILTRNDSKLGPRRTSWFEPIHLSFLEFAFVYSVWVGSVSTHPFFRFHHSINMVDLWRLPDDAITPNLVTSFLCGLCWKQLPTLLSAFTIEHCILADVMWELEQEAMTAENKLELSEAFLPLIPVEFTVHENILGSIPTLLRHAVQTRRDQRIIVEREFHAVKQPQGSLLKIIITTVNSEISQDWRELATSQNITYGSLVTTFTSSKWSSSVTIAESFFLSPNIAFTLCEAPLQQQLQWLSDFMTIEGVLQNKPIHTITYTCPSEQLQKLIDLMTDLIRQERVTGLDITIRKECPCAESWKEFIRCANESKKLLDMSLQHRAGSPLVVDLTPVNGKRWRKVQLLGYFDVSVGSQLVSELNSLDSLLRGMPSNIQSLDLGDRTRVIRNDGLPTAHNVEELGIGERGLSLLQSSVPECLKHLKVLAIECNTDMSEHDVTSFLLSVIFHCHSLVRVELREAFGYGCTERLIAVVVQSLSTAKGPALSDRGESVPTHLHLNTLVISVKESVLTSRTANLVKEALKTGCIERLWLECTRLDADAVRKFVELFSPAEFNIKAVDAQSWSQHSQWTKCILEVSV